MRPPDTVRSIGRACSTCDFWRKERGDSGQCRFNPPQLWSDEFGTFPITQKHDWCGQWEQDEQINLMIQITNVEENLKRWKQQAKGLAGTVNSPSPDSKIEGKD